MILQPDNAATDFENEHVDQLGENGATKNIIILSMMYKPTCPT